MKTLLLTGCSGFIGHHVIKVAQDGKWNVIGVDKRPMSKKHNQPNQFILADVNDLNYRDLMNIDAIVHLAWRTNIGDCIRHPEQSTRDNIDMTVHLLEVAKEAKIKKVIFCDRVIDFCIAYEDFAARFIVGGAFGFNWTRPVASH